MRVRAVLAIVSLLLPASLSAQRFPLPGTSRPRLGRPAFPPKQPEPIARALAYRRWRLSVETSPLISYVQSPGFTNDGRVSSWTAFGAGTRAEYRLTRLASATLDLTSSFLGAPVLVQTVELGTWLHLERSERRVDPFIDLRVGYVSASNRELGPIVDQPFGFPAASAGYGFLYSKGFGGVVGTGVEFGITRTLSLTTGASVMRSRLTTRDFQRTPTVNCSDAMTSYRYTVGIRYNPARLIGSRGTDSQ